MYYLMLVRSAVSTRSSINHVKHALTDIKWIIVAPWPTFNGVC